MPTSMRELLEQVEKKSRRFNPATYALLEALVEAVEPEDTPTDEQYNDARDARIRFLQQELAKAQAKIERLRSWRDFWLAYVRDDQIAYVRDDQNVGDLVEEVKADAEIGQLVLGMRPGSRLTRACTSRYWSELQCGETWVSVGPQVAMLSPTEALRAIQEVGDA